MKALLAWIAAARWRLSLSHCVEGLLIQIPVGLMFGFGVGALAVVVWYWSRKKLEMETAAKTPGASDATVWMIGWFPWQWDRYKLLDVVMPACSSALIAWALQTYARPLSLF
ncbi:hypothetical protein F4827_004513 [Paraburkholderia bannensis]|uniref:Uncharacterized protein n=1 Tax=Paraburkholderia bannensis TaxID=765414 RepID=A0A7W9WUH7_9BURK|nr:MULTISPECIES: hypothetical protein [Paraburkholderia]MBB3259638.1 hypothetical protein [Paraburkholderia sp. WP4_3_2]MBB6104654.1 hypothetical protein [Paraburkholderia bannensis]